MQYTDFQNLPSSEKITLAILSASKRLMGWTLHSGSVYKIENFAYAVIEALEDSGNAYTATTSIGACTASKFYLDRSAQTLYLRTTGSDNPNGRFIAATFNLYFANVPIALPHDLSSGFDVMWEPLIKATSQFGVAIDTINQTSEAIEGTGTLTLYNDFDFWPQNFDKLSFENQSCLLYSYHRDLAPSDARYIFKGSIESRTYAPDAITFQLKDQFAELRNSMILPTIAALGARTGTDLALASQRTIFGRAYGHVPTNIDQVLDGYPVTGTVSLDVSGSVLTGSGTAFLTELSPNDQLILNGTSYSVATVTSDTSLTVSNPYEGTTGLVSASTTVIPDQPKRNMNRIFNLAGHALREPITTIQSHPSTVITLFVDSTRDISDGDTIYIGALGSGETAVVETVIGTNYIRLSTSLATVPADGTAVRRPAVQNVRIGQVPLAYYDDYTLNASTATLTLRSTAESNSAPIYQLNHTITMTIGSRIVTGTGFQAIIKAGYMIGVVDSASFFEVLSVDSDTQLSLRTASTINRSAFTGRYQSLIYDPSSPTLSLDILGRTDDGTTSGVLVNTAPAISRLLLEDAGLSADLDTDSFTAAEDIAYQEIGMVIPATFGDTTIPIYRDVLNRVNKSVFGTLVQNADFQFAYEVLQPNKPTTAPRFRESDIISFSLNSTAQNVVKTVIVEYRPQEYDYTTGVSSVSTQQSTSDNAQYLIGTDISKTISSYLSRQMDADILAARWSFLLSRSTSRLDFVTKLQGATLQVGDIVEIEHRKFYERLGTSLKRKVLLVESVLRDGLTVKISATDLSSTLNSVAAINDFTPIYSLASDDQLMYGGYITDQYGLIDNNPDSFATNLIW